MTYSRTSYGFSVQNDADESMFLVCMVKRTIFVDMKIIEQNIDKIVSLCKKYKVSKLWVFGSVLTHRFNAGSDIDFLVEFDREKLELLDYADNYFGLIHSVESVVGRKVDMVVDSSIRNPYFRAEVDKTRKILWSAM